MSERRCTKCGLLKAPDDFAIRDRETGRRQSWCRTCYAAYRRNYYQLNRIRVIAHVLETRAVLTLENQLRAYQYLASHPCIDCGEQDVVVLESITCGISIVTSRT